VPRPCRLVGARFADLACQFGVGQSLADDLRDCDTEAARVAEAFAAQLLAKLTLICQVYFAPQNGPG
jgi:hypothetical protein